jgi:hypothetical protein
MSLIDGLIPVCLDQHHAIGLVFRQQHIEPYTARLFLAQVLVAR